MPRRTRAANFLVERTPANKNQLSDDRAGMSPMSCFGIMSPNENQLSDDRAGMSPMSCFSIMSPNDINFSIMSPNDIKFLIETLDELKRNWIHASR